MAAIASIYPGDTANAAQIMEMADAYHAAATALNLRNCGAKPVETAPFRLLAIHAIELYLNAYLLARGTSASHVRGLQHDFARRTDLVVAGKLALRIRTVRHLHCLANSREYLTTRYDPELPNASKINRLQATLNEVSRKVTAAISNL